MAPTPSRTSEWTVVDAPAADNTALASKAAEANKSHYVTAIIISVDSGAAGLSLKAILREGAATEKARFYYNTAATKVISFPHPVKIAENTAVALVGDDSGAGITVALTLMGYTV